jgi:hypothetical protein
MAFPREPVPDLLNRFVATPYKLISHGCTIETNDVNLLEIFDDAPFDIPDGYHMRIVRDAELLPMSTRVRIICSAASCLLLARGAVAMIDREHRHAYAFVSSETSAESFAQQYLRVALHHVSEHAKVL